MASIPQELIDAIVELVPHRDALKACSLAASRFLVPSQRILFHTLKIHSAGPASADHLIADSPHLGRYTKDLILVLSPPATVADVGYLQQTLINLPNVQRCTIGGYGRDWPVWGELDMITPAVVDFLTSGRLSYVGIEHVLGFPFATLTSLFPCAQTLYLRGISLNMADQDVVAPPTSRIENIILDTGENLETVLLLPQFTFILKKLRTLWMFRFHTRVPELFTLAAPSLTNVMFPMDAFQPYFEGFHIWFPALRVIDLRSAPFHQGAQYHNIEGLGRLVASIRAPNAEEIRFAYIFRARLTHLAADEDKFAPDFWMPYINPAAVAGLTAALATRPSVRTSWSVGFKYEMDERDQENALDG
ncbi:hypothetical protein C8R46DRAFT_1088561, partial [Mycena filopes]